MNRLDLLCLSYGEVRDCGLGNPEQMLDRWRVGKILAGDATEAERFVRAHYPAILRFLRHLTGRREEAEDLAQAVFLAARAALPSFRFECSLSTWLHRIAYREVARWRRDRRPVESLDGDLASPHPGRGDDAIVLADAIRSLPPELGETFLLHEVQGLGVREVAAVLEIPEGTVKSRLHAARKRLRERLAGTWEGRDERTGGECETI